MSVKHDKNLTDEMLKTHYVSKIHATGIRLYLYDYKERTQMHWRITAECRPIDKTESAKGTSKSKTQKSIFIVIETKADPEDVKRNGGKQNVPTQMITELKSYAHSTHSLIEAKLTFPLKESKKDKMSASELFEWFERKGHLRYKKDENGDGCAYYVKRLITDMKKVNWFDLKDDTTKKGFETLKSFKKYAEIGEDCYMKYGIGTFYKKEMK